MILFCRFGASSLFSSTYGSEATDLAGFSLAPWHAFSDMLAAGMPGAFLVVSQHLIFALL
jgi:hypothetical protein